MEQRLKDAMELRGAGHHKQSIDVLLKLINDYPNDAQINYQCAWSFDLLGEEEKAVPFYEKAIRLGLHGADLEGALLGLGSTYRTLGRYQDAKETFQKGINHFPGNHAMKTFYAMVLYNLNEHQAAMEILLHTLLETTSDNDILAYRKAIEFYSDKLDETWN